MYQQIFDNEIIQIVHQTIRDNLSDLINCNLKDFHVYIISEGVFLVSIINEHSNQNFVVKLDKLNPLKNTLITSCKAVEIISAYELNQNGLGPKLLSVFKNGRIEEYIDGQSIGSQFKDDKELQKQVAECIAKINSIQDVKSERNGNFLNDKVNVFLKLIYKTKSNESYEILSNFITSHLNEKNFDKTINQDDLNTERMIGLENEFKFLTDCLLRLNDSNQIVFSHNDLSQENIYKRLNSTSMDGCLYVLNYDLSGYNYRGYDLAHFLNNILFDFNNPSISIDELNWTNDEELRKFLFNYLIKFNKLNGLENGESIDNDLNKLVKEVKFFKIYSAYLSILVSTLASLDLSNDQIESNLPYLKIRIDVFLKLKQDFLASYTEFL